MKRNQKPIDEFMEQVTPEDTQYIADVNANYDLNPDAENSEDIVYVAKLLGFYPRFKNMHWAAENNSIHTRLDEFTSILIDYIDTIAENIQGIYSQFKDSMINQVEVPGDVNPIYVLTTLKSEVENWFELHEDDMKYEGCRNATSAFLQDINKYIYLLRLCKD